MGWYDHEEKAWLPTWAVPPLLWLGCLVGAVMPAAVVVNLWDLALPDMPLPARLAVYGV